MTPAELRAWKEKHGLTVAELAWIARRSKRTIERKLSGELRITFLPAIIDAYEVLMYHGIRPPRWPADLPPSPTEIRRRKRRRKFRPLPCIGAPVGNPPKRQASGQISAAI